ncbi:MAG: acyl-CoA dehydrogenase family protein, partial [Sulfuritalea sp.]|nr:acyl-CoA dehydrogenase family protein [Sulfuritalea sp.]
AMEVHGGNGYVDEGPMPRLFKQSPLNSIWEGSGNVMCLDTLRAMGRHPKSVEVLAAEIAPALGRNRAFDAFAAKLKDGLANPQEIETRARELTQGIALAMQGALLLRHAPPAVGEAFCASRLTPNHWGTVFGALPATTDFRTLLDRAWPAQ